MLIHTNKETFFRLDHDVLAGLCVSNMREKLELKIDNVFFLCSQSILKINQVTYNVVFAVKVKQMFSYLTMSNNVNYFLQLHVTLIAPQMGWFRPVTHNT